MSLAPLPPSALSFLDFYLPPKSHPNLFTTLTYAASLDSRISLGPGLRTTLSGPESKTMTHYLRSHHDAILVGAGTFVADNPGLNCQYPPADTKNALECSPLPVVLDPGFGIEITQQSKVLLNAAQGIGKYPVVLVSEDRYLAFPDKISKLKLLGVRVLTIHNLSSQTSRSKSWKLIQNTLQHELNVKSVMVEGGAEVINDLLLASHNEDATVNSVIITIAPVYLGKGGVQVAPSLPLDRLTNTKWESFGRDVVMVSGVR
ncbi:dihydrofolate reductase-like domain-containing protein [Kockiozyma suomiensis]|uniref:dihydrofolate reductase-like domain-containing protein n=1 Tax=Kockiozyma suomiensis TaxID=1337062 RepID=UPI00334329FE